MQKRERQTQKIYGGGYALTALTLVFSGILFSNDGEISEAAPTLGKISNIKFNGGNSAGKLTRTLETFKRGITEISGRSHSNIPDKRKKVTIFTQSSTKLDLSGSDGWFMKNKEGGVETVYISSQYPKLLSDEGGINVFETTDKNGKTSIIVVSGPHSTNWYQGRDIDWVKIGDSGENKRHVSDIHGQVSNPIPEKRTKVELKSSISDELKGKDPSTWIMLTSDSDGNETYITSEGRPVHWSTVGDNELFQTETQNGGSLIVRVEASKTSDWYQSGDIVWTNKD